MNIFRKALTLLFKTPLAAMVAMTLIVSALSYTACDIKKAKDADKNDELALAVILLAAASSQFPVTAGNVFSIQFRNSTTVPITVWLMGNQPPCSKAQAELGNCNNTDWQPADYETHWNTLRTNGYFSASGTHFYNISRAGVNTEINISNRIVLQTGETLRVVPPLVDDKPQWYWNEGGVAKTAGTNAWVTKTKNSKGVDISMTSPGNVLLYEYNVNYPSNNCIWDLSAVDGLNVKVTMSYEGAGCGSTANCGCDKAMPRVSKANIAAYNGSNDGCPYTEDSDTGITCPSPKHYPATITGSVVKPSWVVGTNDYTTANVSSEPYKSLYLDPAGSPSALTMTLAGVPGEDTPAHRTETYNLKKAYHVWWSTNPLAQGWLNYLQHNTGGTSAQTI